MRYLPSVTVFQPTAKEKVDYKLVLNEAEFTIFSKLREIRKKIATADAVPAYAVFTDEELAGIARLPVETWHATSQLNNATSLLMCP